MVPLATASFCLVGSAATYFTEVSSAGSGGSVGIIAGNQAVDALAVLGQLAGDGSRDLVRSGSDHLDLGDLTANDGVASVITKLLGVVDRGLPFLSPLMKNTLLGCR